MLAPGYPIDMRITDITQTHVGFCGGLKMIGPGHGTIRRYSFVGIGVVFVEEMCH